MSKLARRLSVGLLSALVAGAAFAAPMPTEPRLELHADNRDVAELLLPDGATMHVSFLSAEPVTKPYDPNETVVVITSYGNITIRCSEGLVFLNYVQEDERTFVFTFRTRLGAEARAAVQL